jgi:hypothetical protein
MKLRILLGKGQPKQIFRYYQDWMLLLPECERIFHYQDSDADRTK